MVTGCAVQAHVRRFSPIPIDLRADGAACHRFFPKFTIVAPHPPASRRRITIRLDELRLLQHAAYDLPLHTDPPPVNNTQRSESQLVRLFQISLHDALHIPRRNAVQIENIRDGNAYRLVAH